MSSIQKNTLIYGALLFLVIFSGSFSYAQNCRFDMDLRDQGSAELRRYFKTPISQGHLGWCGRYTANEILSQKMGRPLSAHYTGILSLLQGNATGKPFYRLKDQTLDDGDFVGRVIVNIQRAGRACPASIITSHGKMNMPYLNGTLGFDNQDFYQSLGRLQKNECDELCQKIVRQGTAQFLGPFTLESLTHFLRRYPDFPLENVIVSFMDHSCRNDFVKIPGDLKVSTYRKILGKLDGPAMANRIDKVLESGRMIGVSYRMRHVLKPEMTPKQDFHASVIVGRKSVNGQCRYIIRNTWGDSCNYKTGVICDPKTGSYLVTRETLQNMSSVVNYIQ